MSSLSNAPAGVTSREIDKESLMDDEIVICSTCNAEINYCDKGIVEVARVAFGQQYFCDNACRSRKVYEETSNATGRAALKRLVAALHLLMDEDATALVPALAIYDADEVLANPFFSKRDRIDLGKFREHAMAFLELLSPDFVEWASDAQDAAAVFAMQLGDEEVKKSPANTRAKAMLSARPA